jgi:SNF2 family DNA or RNA helicase
MYFSTRHNAIVYKGIDAGLVVSAIPAAWRLDEDEVAIPYDMASMQMARGCGLPAYSPITSGYDWPIHPGMQPMAHQIRMAAFMTLHPRCFNLSDMRTGKTLAALWAFDYLKQQGLVDRALVVAKLSTLERVWLREIFANFIGRLSGVVVYGDRDERLRCLDREADLYIINYDGLAIGTAHSGRGLELGPVAKRLRDDPRLGLVIIDESSAYRNSGTRRWKIMRQMLVNKPYVWQMTGTPTPNAPTDAHAQKRLVFPATENFLAFRSRTMYQLNKFLWKPRQGAAAVVAGFLQPAIRFERAECMDLPDMVYDPPLQVDLTAEQKVLLANLERDLQIILESGAQITAVNEAALRIKLIQILLGAVYDEAHKAHRVDASPRLEALKEVIEEAGGKCLVFAPLTSVVELLHSELVKAKISCAMVTGAVSGKERNNIFRDFTDRDDPRIIVADPGTVAHGLDLSAANTIVWYGPTDRVEDYVQANQRISGPNQRRGMLIVRLVATQIERTIFARLDAKQNLQGVILDLVKEGRTDAAKGQCS